MYSTHSLNKGRKLRKLEITRQKQASKEISSVTMYAGNKIISDLNYNGISIQPVTKRLVYIIEDFAKDRTNYDKTLTELNK